MSTPDADSVRAGQAIYSPLTLAFYDLVVLGISNHLLWRCPTAELRALYDRNVGRRHLDIGVGTGYFLDRARWPVPRPEITLLDLNAASLAAAAGRIARYKPKTVAANALEPLPVAGPFDSAGLCYLLHCVPGTIPDKAAIFDNIPPVMAPGGRVFGATIVQGDARRGAIAQRLMDVYNRKRIFSNAGDRVEDLEAALKPRFADVRVALRGVVALFEARVG